VKKQKDHIGIKIKRIRAYKGMNQEDLAKAIGKTRSLISHFERTGNVNKYTLIEIANALDIEVEELEAGIVKSSKNGMEESEKEIVVKTDRLKEIIEKQKQEIKSLKNTVNNQWKLLHELSKRMKGK
jgi:transcriptional regulator with XRE-family HTH domain